MDPKFVEPPPLDLEAIYDVPWMAAEASRVFMGSLRGEGYQRQVGEPEGALGKTRQHR